MFSQKLNKVLPKPKVAVVTTALTPDFTRWTATLIKPPTINPMSNPAGIVML